MTEALAEVYEKMSFDDVCTLIREKQANMALNYVAIGFFLRKARERELYIKGDYKNIFEMANAEFGMARQTAEHCMRVNEKFSEDGYSPKLAQPYREYGKSQLQEMLYLTDEQLEDVRPDMTVKDIRNIRKPVEEPVEAPEPKPEQKQGRKPTEEEREILKELARKLIRMYKDWMSMDYHTRVMNVMTSYPALREQMGKSGSYTIYFPGKTGTYHANLFEGYVQLWLWEEHDGCLGNIESFYLAAAIQSMWNVIALEEAEKKVQQVRAESEECSTSSKVEEELSDLDILKDRLERENRLLGIALKELGDEDRHTRQQKLIVAALAAAVCDMEGVDVPVEELVQPELPILKNNEQRREWLKTYRDWGLWYRDENIGVEYYKYDFPNGARLIAEVYVRPGCGRNPIPFETAYLHLVGGPDAAKGSDGIGKWQRHEYYNRYPNSDTELSEFLKAVQKNG